LLAIAVQGQQDLVVDVGGGFGERRLLRPGQDRLDGLSLEADTGLPQALVEAIQSRLLDGRRGWETFDQMPRHFTVPEFVEAAGEAGECRVEMLADLAAESTALFHQPAAMTHEQL
jgi:hypothetical protein